MKDQWDYVQSVPEEHWSKRLFPNYQSNTDISFLLLLLLPSTISIDRPPNIELVEIDSEDNSWSSIAPSSSGCTVWECRRRLITLFEQCVRARARTHPPSPPADIFFLWKCAIKANVVGILRQLNNRGPGSSSRPRCLPPRPALTPIAPPLRGAATSAGNPRGKWEKSRTRLGQKWPRSVHVCLRHMHCVMCVTPCARVHAHCYARHASFVRCQQCVRARARTHPPSPPADILLWKCAIKANVVGSLR